MTSAVHPTPGAPAAIARPDDRAALRPPEHKRAGRLSSGGYSRFVQSTKLALASVTLVLVALIGVWPHLQPRDGGAPLGIAQGVDGTESLHMVNPRYSGLDENSLPYEVTADLATQASAKSDLITLDNPKADMTMKDGSWIALSALSGLYGQKSQQLDLSGEVNLFHDSGYEFTSTSATIDLATGAGRGREHTIGHGPAGEIEGEGFSFTDKGKTIIFTGKSRLLLYPKAEDGLKRASPSATAATP